MHQLERVFPTRVGMNRPRLRLPAAPVFPTRVGMNRLGASAETCTGSCSPLAWG